MTLEATYKTARRIAVLIIGSTVVLVGVAMIVLPGPAIVVIPAGLAILGLEFAWARRWLRVLRERSQDVYDTFVEPVERPAAVRDEDVTPEAR